MNIAVLFFFGHRCEALIDTDLGITGDVMDCIKVTSSWFDDVKRLPLAKMSMEMRPAAFKKNLHLSERGLETFRRISKKRYVHTPSVL
jgi:hypothetical protein